MEKTVISCNRKYLKDCGVDSILANNKVFRSGVVTRVLEGGHYTRGLRVLSIFSEVMQRLRLKSFFQCHSIDKYPDLIRCITQLQNQFRNDFESEEIRITYTSSMTSLNQLLVDFDAFVESGVEISANI